MIDRTHNLSQLELAPVDFQQMYLEESKQLFGAIGFVDHKDYPALKQEYFDAMEAVATRLLAN